MNQVFLQRGAELRYLFHSHSAAFFSGRDSGNPPRTRIETTCQRLDTLASRALSDTRCTKEQTEQRVPLWIRL